MTKIVMKIGKMDLTAKRTAKTVDGADPTEMVTWEGYISRPGRTDPYIKGFKFEEIWGVVTGFLGKVEVHFVMPVDADRGGRPYDQSEGPGLSNINNEAHILYSLLEDADRAEQAFEDSLTTPEDREEQRGIELAEAKAGWDPNP